MGTKKRTLKITNVDQVAIYLDLTRWELLQQMYNDAQKHCTLLTDMKRKKDYTDLMAEIAMERKGYVKAYIASKTN